MAGHIRREETGNEAMGLNVNVTTSEIDKKQQQPIYIILLYVNKHASIKIWLRGQVKIKST